MTFRTYLVRRMAAGLKRPAACAVLLLIPWGPWMISTPHPAHAPVRVKARVVAPHRITVPVPAYNVSYSDPQHLAPAAYTDTQTGTVYMPNGPDPDVLKHEMGHLFDAQKLTNFDRQQIAQQVFRQPSRPWQDQTVAGKYVPGNEELFAEAYRNLLEHRAFTPGRTYQDYYLPPDGGDGSTTLSYSMRGDRMEMLRTWLANLDRLRRDASGRPIGFK